LGPIPNPQSPIPNPQSPKNILYFFSFNLFFYNNKLKNKIKKNYG